MAIKHITVREAEAQLESGAAYIDVRSIPEFAQGHPKGAFNVPLLHLDERTGQMSPNRDFVPVVMANFPAGSPLLIGCQVGGRSAQAAQILAGAGYSNVANVLGGFGGARDQMTGRVAEGWAQAGLPVESEPAPGESYRGLLAKTQQGRK
jgi:rhodanese-related sulfurtransferase